MKFTPIAFALAAITAAPAIGILSGEPAPIALSDPNSGGDWNVVVTFRNGERFDSAVIEHGQSLADCFEKARAGRFYYDTVAGREISVSYACER